MGRSFEVDVTTTATEGDRFEGSVVIGEMAADVSAVKVTGYKMDDPATAATAVGIVASWEPGPAEGTTTITVTGSGPVGLAIVSVGIGQVAPGHAWDEQPEAIAGVDPAAAAIPPHGLTVLPSPTD